MTRQHNATSALVTRLQLVALAAVAALVCLSLRVVRLPERAVERMAPGALHDAPAVATLPPVVVTRR